MSEMKKRAAEKAIEYVEDDMIVGVGTVVTRSEEHTSELQSPG